MSARAFSVSPSPCAHLSLALLSLCVGLAGVGPGAGDDDDDLRSRAMTGNAGSASICLQHDARGSARVMQRLGRRSGACVFTARYCNESSQGSGSEDQG